MNHLIIDNAWVVSTSLAGLTIAAGLEVNLPDVPGLRDKYIVGYFPIDAGVLASTAVSARPNVPQVDLKNLAISFQFQNYTNNQPIQQFPLSMFSPNTNGTQSIALFSKPKKIVFEKTIIRLVAAGTITNSMSISLGFLYLDENANPNVNPYLPYLNR